MLHGDILNAEVFAPQVPVLQSKHRLIIPERRGHGRTPDPGDEFTYDLFAKDTVAFVDALGLRDVNVLGHSGGADMALAVAASRPNLVSKLIAVSGESSLELTPEKKAKVLAQTPEEFRRGTPMAVDAYERVTPDGVGRFPLFFEKIKRLWTTDWKIPDEKLASISAKTMIMLGDHDFGSVEEAVPFSRKIPGAELCIVPGAGHGLMREKADIVNKVILDLDEQTSCTGRGSLCASGNA